MWFVSCQEGELDMDDNFIYTSTYTSLIDTVTIQLSTIVDTVKTTSTGNALIGYHQHPIMGGQTAQSYFSLSAPSNFSWDTEKEVFDSLVLVLRPTGYSIGDTTVDALFNVHELTETIELNDDGSLYNTNSFAFKETPISTESFRPYPQKEEEVNMRLDDTYAISIIDFLNTYKNHTDKNSLFEEDYKGFVINCDTTQTRAAMAFEVSDSTSYLRLYSHTVEQEKIEKEQTFSLKSTTQFNEIYAHNKDIIFNQLEDKKSRLTEQSTDGMVILQSGLGYKFRVDLPSLNNLIELETKGHIVKAELRIHPNMDIMQTDELPSTLYIGDIYRANEIWGYLTDTNSNLLTSVLTVDRMYHENTYYSFDLTYYINSRMQEAVVDTDQGLFITLPDDDMGSSLMWLAVNGHSITNNNSKLLLYYYYYDNE
ncbi:DUF4270 family protein [Carboxylicivirga sp. A043]|uniref:DUF4270 domain-containing protein n=1 Tax=Carboxylicivirga litoralis TaxID=2816963 RepID=UPI0021CB4CDA|nr:DUF4270 domain-containing protein [Carboxylicivirga sp. A043]MCU4155805.1 DUF4270 family protein [Carboxylicivirga sp. A043]